MSESKTKLNSLHNFKDYQVEERHLLDSLFIIPGLEYVEGWLYHYFNTIKEPALKGIEDSFGNPPFYRREFINKKYCLSDSEIAFFNEGKILFELDRLFENFHLKLRRLHLKYHRDYCFELLMTYAHSIYWLKGYVTVSPFQEGKIVNTNINWNPILSFIKKNSEELILELGWRMNRLNPNNYHNYNPSNEELRMYFESIFVRGFKLINEQAFKDNFEKLYKLLVPTYFHKETTVEQLDKLFKGTSQLFPGPLVWVGKTNTLSYFLRELHQQHKLAKNTYFKTAEKLISDEKGRLFENLKNSKSVPKNDLNRIDEIITLF